MYNSSCPARLIATGWEGIGSGMAGRHFAHRWMRVSVAAEVLVELEIQTRAEQIIAHRFADLISHTASLGATAPLHGLSLKRLSTPQGLASMGRRAMTLVIATLTTGRDRYSRRPDASRLA